MNNFFCFAAFQQQRNKTKKTTLQKVFIGFLGLSWFL